MTNSQSLAKWMLLEHARFHSLKKIPRALRDKIEIAAKRALEIGEKNKSLRIFTKKGRMRAILFQAPSHEPRMRGQQSLHLYYDKKFRAQLIPWLKEQLPISAKKSPRYTTIILSPADDPLFKAVLEKAGFQVRYEILVGNTKTALKNLKKAKNPPRDLEHLGLEIKQIQKVSELKAVMRLQKEVALQSRSHSYFSHTRDRLRRDREHYVEHVAKKNGLLLGVYRNKKILGVMLASIQAEITGGLSVFLHRSSQG